MTQTKRGRKPAALQHAGTGHMCGECGRGEWNTENLNYKRCPFLIYCKYSQYAHSKDGRGVCFDSTTACDHFEAGTKKGGRV